MATGWLSLAASGSLLLAAFPVPGEPRPDRVELTNGTVLEGQVVFEDEKKLVLRVKSQLNEIPQDEVALVQASLRSLPLALERMDALENGRLSKYLELARELQNENLPREAALLYWRVLSLDPANETAHQELGHRRRGDKWVIQHGGGWFTLEKLATETQDWGDAWEFETTHYRVRTNLSLAQALGICRDLEHVYRAFHDVVGQAVEIHEPSEPMEAWIHADAVSYPEPGDGRLGYFESGVNRLRVDASRGLDASTIVHEATHQLLHTSAEKSGRGEIPGWLDEGLAVYIEAAASGSPGRLVFRPGTPHGAFLAIHAQARKPYDLDRVLGFEAGDFMASSRADLKYAQAYSLVHFCLEGDERAWRAGFVEFVRGAYQGRSSVTSFKKTVPDARGFERAWRAQVQAWK